MGTGFINSGISGIQSAQIGLQTASHNITNANTPGFNRQRIIQSTNIALLSGAGFIGQGTHVSTVERMYSGFLNSQVNSAQTKVSELGSYYTQVSQIDNMLADPNSGLSPALQDFFTGVQQVTANPSQLPARQAMVSSAQALVARFQGLEDRLSQMYDDVNGQIGSTVSSINSYAEQIGVLNEQIIIAQSSISQPANDLLDQRDQLVSELNKLVKVSTTTNTNGSFNVFIGSGQQLVVGTQVSKMTSAPSSADPTRFTVGLQTAGGSQELPESLINGGTLGGLLRFRNESLDRVANDLGRNAASVALTFNAQNALGQDLLGNITGDLNFVGDFFNVQKSINAVSGSLNAAGNPTVSIDYTSPPPFTNGNFYTDLTNSDYRLASDGTNLTLTRLTDNKTWVGADVAAVNALLVADPQGFSLSDTVISNGDVYASGASYLIQPTRAAARNISMNTAVAADPRLIAAAGPMRTTTGATNTGKAVISASSVGTGYPSAPFTLAYSGGNLTGFPAGNNVLVTIGGVATPYAAPALSIPYTSGATITIVGTTPPGGISFEITGTPNNNDTFTIARNAGGVSDGRNALAMGKLQTQNTMSGQTASYQAAYAQLVSDNGNKTRELKVTGAAQQALLDQSSASREALSGVNLDEEAANLIRYQQAYQASAKVMDVGSKLFDVLLAISA
jgi:flagellar hook-associated protein 1 FlgK